MEVFLKYYTMKKFKLLLILLAINSVAIYQIGASVINIPADFPNIQAGINIAVDGDTVLVQPGNYIENINFNGKNIVVGSLFLITHDTAYISQTIIDGNENGSVVTFNSGEELSSKITGFTITNGYSNNYPIHGGGGVKCVNSSPTIENNIIKENICDLYIHGGGIYCENSNSHILNNAICYNEGAYYGGGIYVSDASSVLIKGNIIYNNITESGLSVDGGGGICLEGNEGYCIIENTTIYNNIVEWGWGGGIYCFNNFNLTIENVTIFNNSAPTGGGIYCHYNSNPSLENVTISNNTAYAGGGICCQDNCNPCLINCIMWNNSPQEIFFTDYYYYPNTITIAYSDIEGGIEAIDTNNNGTVNWLEGNIDADPLFANSANGDYHLTWDNYPIPDETKSPCIDTGDPSSPFDPDGTIADMGAFYFDQSQTFIEISGPQSGVWPAGNTYHAIGDISVSIGDTLIIEPGVIIKFMDYYSFNISGSLFAVGTEADPIFFTSGQPNINPGDWNEIKFEETSNDNSMISYVTIEYASFGIYCYESSPFINNNTISNNSYDGMYCSNNSSPFINNNTISNNNYDGICCGDFSSPTIISNNIFSNNSYGIYSFTSSFSTISNNTISNNGLGIWCYNSSPTINNNIISDNNDIGILCFYSSPSISNNTITNNPYGIDCYESSPPINKNTIINNSIGINCYNISSPAISNNTISNNVNGIDCRVSSFPLIVNNILYENAYGINAETTPSSLEFNLFFENNTTAIGDGLPVDFGEIVSVNANNDPCDSYMNLFMDPDFVDPGNFNFHLMENSPCIDAGNPDPIFCDPDGTIADIGAFYFNHSQVTQAIILSSGFSFVSSHILPENPDMLIVIADVLNENFDFVRNSQGQTLRKIGPNWVNGIGDWIVDEGYLVKMFADDSFSIDGTLVDPITPIPVESGFQFISYFPENSMDAILAFATIINDDLDFIRDSEGTMIRKIGPNWVNGLGDCQPGEGYLIKMFTDGVLIYPGFSSFTCGDPFTDPRDEQTYTTVQIGDQCWMAENLNIGTMINGSENMTVNGVIEKYCYDNEYANCDEYGGLYQWNEIMEYVTDTAVQGICPEGWYVPTDLEWKVLEGTVDSQYPVGDPIWNNTGLRGYDAGLNLKSTSGWYGGGNGSGLFGYKALFGGYRNFNSSFLDLTYIATFWSSSESNADNALFRSLFYNTALVYRDYTNKDSGFSVRCVQDNSTTLTDGRSPFDNLSIQEKDLSYELTGQKLKNLAAPNFLFEGGNPADPVYTIYVEGLEIGDEVAAYDGDIIVGALKVNSEEAFDNEMPIFSSLTNGTGYKNGNPITLKVWSENKLLSASFTMEAIYDSYVSDVYPEGDGKFSVVNIDKGSIKKDGETIFVYPNPSKGIFNISVEGIKGDILIKVFDLRGKEYFNFELNGSTSTQLDLRELPAGVYFISFSGKDFNDVKKIVIK